MFLAKYYRFEPNYCSHIVKLFMSSENYPTVDDENKEIIMNPFLELKSRGKTIVIVTHDKSLDPFFDRIVKLD